jgi:hypothetical protein
MADIVEQPTRLYEADEYAWIERQIASLRDGDLDRLDRANLIAYLGDMAISRLRGTPLSCLGVAGQGVVFSPNDGKPPPEITARHLPTDANWTISPSAPRHQGSARIRHQVQFWKSSWRRGGSASCRLKSIR